ncbi:MAG: radical SAM protein [Candidatus Hydrogenedentota bacterium]|nr:MAG: radical SAM protein [Candidatus Hydrogenedentota bacterium]
MRVFLADLTYTTLSLATEAFPLNIGFLAAWGRKRFGTEVSFTLFKYIDDLEEALHHGPPDILGMSNYPWNCNLGMEFFKYLDSAAPQTLRIMGGPNIPASPQEQQVFLEQHPLIDFYVYLEGEEGFGQLLEVILSKGLSRSALKDSPIDGVLFRRENTFCAGRVLQRMRNLNEIPSPYLEGFMDKFFDDKLSPFLQTNRGCPFTCTFCHEGKHEYTRVNYFELDRVLAELDYIVQHVHPSVLNLMFADSNFGMYERDYEICRHIAELQRRYDWPKTIFASTGKNRKDRIARNLELLRGTMKVWLSVQSMDDEVLRNIKRENISLDAMIELQDSLSKKGLTTHSELILGLPGDSVERHIRSIAKLVEAEVDTITTYTLMLLNGTELNTPQEREKHGIRSHFRILPRDFALLRHGAVAVEVEEVVTSTNTLSFEDYCLLRKFHFIINVVYNGKPFAPLFRFLKEQRISLFLFLKSLLDDLSSAPLPVREIAHSFEEATREELWPSYEDLISFATKRENYRLLLEEKVGTNLIQTHLAKSLRHMDAWCSYVFSQAGLLLKQNTAAENAGHSLRDIEAFCRCRVYRPLDESAFDFTPVVRLNHDIPRWMSSPKQVPLEHFFSRTPRKFSFPLEESKKDIFRKFLRRFGTTSTGIGRILTKVDITKIWREACSRSNGREVPFRKGVFEYQTSLLKQAS